MTTSPAELVAGVVNRAHERLARVRSIAWLEKHHVYASAADVGISVKWDGKVSLQCSTLAGAERLAGRLALTERRDLEGWGCWVGVSVEGVAVEACGPVPS